MLRQIPVTFANTTLFRTDNTLSFNSKMQIAFFQPVIGVTFNLTKAPVVRTTCAEWPQRQTEKKFFLKEQ